MPGAMDPKHILVSAVELVVTITTAVLVVYLTMRALIRTNTDFDEDKAILKNNLAVGILVMALLLAAASMMQQAFAPLADVVRFWLTSPLAESMEQWSVGLWALADLAVAFGIVVATLSFSLRLYGRMARTKDTRPGIELEKGNTAVGIILASVVLVVAMFVGDGVRTLCESLITLRTGTILIGICEFAVTAAMAVAVIYVTLRALIKTNTDFDEDAEILKNNVSVGLLVGALLLASANMMHAAFSPIVETVHRTLTSPLVVAAKQWKLALHAAGNLVLAYFIVVTTLSFSLRFFGRMARAQGSRPGKELERGNLAMGILLSVVVLVVSMFVGEGVGALSDALLPKPAVGRMMIMR